MGSGGISGFVGPSPSGKDVKEECSGEVG